MLPVNMTLDVALRIPTVIYPLQPLETSQIPVFSSATICAQLDLGRVSMAATHRVE